MAEHKMPLDSEEVTPEIITPEEVRRRHERGQEKTKKKKKSYGQRFKDLIFVAGPEEVKESLIEDVIKPSIRDFIADMLYTAVDVAVYGRSGGGRKRRKGGRVTVRNDRELTDYNGVFGNRKKPKKTNGYDFRDVMFDDRRDADLAFDDLYDMLCEKNVVDVATYYDIAREHNGRVLVEEDHTDRDWGWRSLDGTGYHHDADGYALILPKPEWLKR